MGGISNLIYSSASRGGFDSGNCNSSSEMSSDFFCDDNNLALLLFLFLALGATLRFFFEFVLFGFDFFNIFFLDVVS